MSGDLIRELKDRLRVEEVIGRTLTLVADGREFTTKEHDSLKISPGKQAWSWFSQATEAGEAVAGGDVLSWIAFQRFGKRRVDGEQFVEVLKEACALAGIDYPERAEKGARDPRTAELRGREEILERYVQVSEGLRDAGFLAHARQRKGWLTAEICERWRIGPAPTVGELTKAGISEDELKRCGLLRCSERGEWYPFFRESIVVPCIERGRVVYLSSRYLSDVDRRGERREKKTLHLVTPHAARDGELSWAGITAGLPRPCAFNLDALNERPAALWLVEGPLDAIAVTERGRAAVALFSATPSEELVRRLRAS